MPPGTICRAVGKLLDQVLRGREKRGGLAIERQGRAGHAVDELGGEASLGFGIRPARGAAEPEQSIERGEANGLAELEQAIAIEVEHLIEKSADVVPVLVGELDARVQRFLAKALPVSPAAHVFQVPKAGEVRVREDDGIHSLGG